MKLITLITLAAWGLLILSMKRDRSRYRNCIFLTFAVFCTLDSVLLALANVSFGTTISAAIIFILMLTLLLVPVFLIFNGLYMFAHEGKSLANALSLILGCIVGGGEIATFGYAFTTTPIVYSPVHMFLYVVSISVIYGSMSFVSFMFYTILLQAIPHKRDFDYVIIHGAGLIHGDKVSKLLAERIDKAIEIYRKDPTPPILIPSGGQGKDETVPEGKAMADYLRAKGIPEEHILEENESKTTYENIVNSKKLIDQRDTRKYVALVTSNYHVYRALRYARVLKFPCVGIGSHVASYYWPSALIREYVAIHREPKHLIIFILGWLFCLSPFFLSIIR